MPELTSRNQLKCGAFSCLKGHPVPAGWPFGAPAAGVRR